MTKEVGTLVEIGAKPGDVVEWPGIGEYLVLNGGGVVSKVSGGMLKDGIDYPGNRFRIVSRASDKQETKEVGTLAELNVKPGDVVEFVEGYDGMYPEYEGKRMVGDSDGGVSFDTGNGFCGDALHIFRIVSRASEKPKLWRDMTPEEKGALLLAMHDGLKVEFCSAGKWLEKKFMPFLDDHAYRIKPEPKVETVNLYSNDCAYGRLIEAMRGHRITFNLIGGEPDCTSIKMEKL